jgi:hypothetical protein
MALLMTYSRSSTITFVEKVPHQSLAHTSFVLISSQSRTVLNIAAENGLYKTDPNKWQHL